MADAYSKVPSSIIVDSETGIPKKGKDVSAAELTSEAGTTEELLRFVLGGEKNDFGWMSPTRSIATDQLPSAACAQLPRNYFYLTPDKRISGENIRDALSGFTVRKPDFNGAQRAWHGDQSGGRFIEFGNSLNQKHKTLFNSQPYKAITDATETAIGRTCAFEVVTEHDISSTYTPYTIKGHYASDGLGRIYIPEAHGTDVKHFSGNIQVSTGSRFKLLKDPDDKVGFIAAGYDSTLSRGLRSLDTTGTQANNVRLFMAQNAAAILTTQYALDNDGRLALAKKLHPDKPLKEQEKIASEFSHKDEKLVKMQELHQAALKVFSEQFKFTGKISGDNSDKDRLTSYIEKNLTTKITDLQKNLSAFPAGSKEALETQEKIEFLGVQKSVAEKVHSEHSMTLDYIGKLREATKGDKNYEFLNSNTIDTAMVVGMMEKGDYRCFYNRTDGKGFMSGYLWMTQFSGLSPEKMSEVVDPIKCRKGENVAKTLRFLAAHMDKLIETNLVNLDDLKENRPAGYAKLLDLPGIVQTLCEPTSSGIPENAYFLSAAFQAQFVKPKETHASARRAYAFQHLCTALSAYNDSISKDDFSLITKSLQEGTFSTALERLGLTLSDMHELADALDLQGDAGDQFRVSAFTTLCHDVIDKQGVKLKAGTKDEKMVIPARWLAVIGSNVEVDTGNSDNSAVSYYVLTSEQQRSKPIGQITVSQSEFGHKIAHAKAQEFKAARLQIKTALDAVVRRQPILGERSNERFASATPSGFRADTLGTTGLAIMTPTPSPLRPVALLSYYSAQDNLFAGRPLIASLQRP